MGTSYRLTIAFVGVTLTSLAMVVPVTEQAAQLDLTSEALVLTSGQFACPVGMVDAAYAGPPSWASSLSYLELKEIPGQTQKDFAAWAESELPGTYPSGSTTAYWRNVINAYSDGDYDTVAQKVYWFGGGHSDSPCNGLFAFDPWSLTWGVTIPPTPWAKLPTAYQTQGTTATFTYPVIYPNTTDFFMFTQTAETLDAADASLGADQEAPVSRHSYGCMTAYNGKINIHAPHVAQADVALQTWDYLLAETPATAGSSGGGYNNYPGNLSNPYGPQIFAGGWGVDEATLNINTHAMADPYTGLAYVCNNGTSDRSGFLCVDTSTHTITKRVAGFGISLNARVGFDATHVYVLGSVRGRADLPEYLEQTGTHGQGSQNALCISDKATNTPAYHALTGDICAFYPIVSTAEEIPSFFDGTHFWLWPYYTEPGFVYRINVSTRVSTKLVITTTGTLPTIAFKYKLHYIPQAQCAIFCASATGGWWALKTA